MCGCRREALMLWQAVFAPVVCDALVDVVVPSAAALRKCGNQFDGVV
jgi:hypothetical protein